MKIALHSDFRDYYDHWFCGTWENPDIIFKRMTSSGFPRPAMLQYLQELGLTVPAYGRVVELVHDLKMNIDEDIREGMSSICSVVIHNDINAHAGEGKILCSYNDALENYPNAFAVEHIPSTPSGMGLSLRYLRVGLRQFWLRYSSSDDWRSNCGEVNIELLCEESKVISSQLMGVPYPLFAVDFIIGDKLYAVDFNIAPGVKGTGIEAILPAVDAHQAIVDAIKLLRGAKTTVSTDTLLWI